MSIQTDILHSKPPSGSLPVAAYATADLLHRFTLRGRRLTATPALPRPGLLVRLLERHARC